MAARSSVDAPWLRRFSQVLGDGVTETFNVTHNLGTRLISVTGFLELAGSVSVSTPGTGFGLTLVDENTVQLAFVSAPLEDTFTIVIIG